ncbi:MAG: transglutaminase-like domain-containing protein, partial [Treponema sp.]|nr:transglutaminase-like domain-containing protein [Treponema sp.]
QKEVIDNFTYDYAAFRDMRKFQYLSTKEDFYTYGKGVCENYANFFILLAQENGLLENLYKVSGNGKSGGHAWLEYRTAENTYIIDPTWSDDYAYTEGKDTKQKFRESPAYGKVAFFITYAEDKRIFVRQGYDHSSFPRGKKVIPLWEEAGEEVTMGNEQ